MTGVQLTSVPKSLQLKESSLEVNFWKSYNILLTKGDTCLVENKITKQFTDLAIYYIFICTMTVFKIN